jgi:hypothetical protein
LIHGRETMEKKDHLRVSWGHVPNPVPNIDATVLAVPGLPLAIQPPALPFAKLTRRSVQAGLLVMALTSRGLF